MTISMIDFKRFVAAVGEEISVCVHTLKTRGSKRFERALGAAIAPVLISYFCVYTPLQKMNARAQSEIERVKMVATSSSQFQDLRDILGIAYAGLPRPEDRAEWLSNSVRDSLDADNLETDNVAPIDELEIGGIVFQSTSLSMKLRFSQFYDWLLRLESAKPLMHVQSVDLSKTSDSIGVNKVMCAVSTAIPIKRYN